MGHNKEGDRYYFNYLIDPRCLGWSGVLELGGWWRVAVSWLGGEMELCGEDQSLPVIVSIPGLYTSPLPLPAICLPDTSSLDCSTWNTLLTDWDSRGYG